MKINKNYPVVYDKDRIMLVIENLGTYIYEPTPKTDNFYKKSYFGWDLYFWDQVMPEYQLIEKNENIAKRNFFLFLFGLGSTMDILRAIL